MSTHHAPASSRHDPGRHDPFRDDGGRDVDGGPSADEVAPSRVLWGRVAVLAAALLLAFVAGRVTTSGEDAAAVAQAEDRIADLAADLEQARAELDAVRAGGTDAAADEAPADPGDEAEAQQDVGSDADADAGAGAGAGAGAESRDGAEASDEADAAEEAAEPAAEAPEVEAPADPTSTTYTVQPGDYLFGLAEQFYGEGRQWPMIAEANDLGAGAVLSPGQTLEIPAAQ
jgi:nucleoid-associated protein YgaU